MTTMVELISKALEPFFSSADRAYGEHAKAARAAIAAMREPTEWRIDSEEGKAIMQSRRAGYVAACHQNSECNRAESDRGSCAWCADVADSIIEAHWQAAIDEALK